MTIAYSDPDIAFIQAENELIIYRWGEDGWVDAAESCEPPADYLRDEAANQIGLPVCHAGRFALFAPARRAFLPLLQTD
jgi:hypothetical protein